MKHRQQTQSRILADMVDRQPTDIKLDTGSDVLVYLIHGITGTPAEMHYVARRLARHGWNVYATTLPGHCTRLRDLVRTNESEWRRHVRTQLAYVRERYPLVFVVGLCAGGLLALDGATAIALDGVGVLSPTFTYDGWNIPWTHALLPFGMKVLPRWLQSLLFYREKAPFGVKDEVLQARIRDAYSPLAWFRRQLRSLRVRWKRQAGRRDAKSPSAAATGYSRYPLKTFTDINQLITGVRTRLGQVTAPTVILQSSEDDITHPRNAYLVYNEISSQEKHVTLLEDCYHVLTVDKQKHLVVDHLISFFNKYVARRRVENRSEKEWETEAANDRAGARRNPL